MPRGVQLRRRGPVAPLSLGKAQNGLKDLLEGLPVSEVQEMLSPGLYLTHELSAREYAPLVEVLAKKSKA